MTRFFAFISLPLVGALFASRAGAALADQPVVDPQTRAALRQTIKQHGSTSAAVATTTQPRKAMGAQERKALREQLQGSSNAGAKSTTPNPPVKP